MDIDDEQQRQREQGLKLPKGFCSWLPKSSVTTIAALVRKDLPRQSHALNLTAIDKFFSLDPACTPLEALQHRPIPNPKTISQLQKYAPEAWFRGHKSVHDPQYNEGKDRFPLYVIHYWSKMEKRIKEREAWRKGITWVTEKQNELAQDEGTSNLVKNLQIHDSFHAMTLKSMCKLRWGEVSVEKLTNFLGDRTWMASDNVDLMMDVLADRISNNSTRRGRIWVLPTGFSEGIAMYGNADEGIQTDGKRLLRKYEHLVTDRGVEQAYAPFHIGGNHWVALCLDFKRGKITYGDSLEWNKLSSPPKQQMKVIKKWAGDLGWKMNIGGNELKHARQTDTCSCGMITANTIEVNVFNATIWKDAEITQTRLRWYTEGIKRLTPALPTRTPQNAKMTLSALLNDDDSMPSLPRAAVQSPNSPTEVPACASVDSRAEVDEGMKVVDGEEGGGMVVEEKEGDDFEDAAMDVDVYVDGTDDHTALRPAKIKAPKRPRSPVSDDTHASRPPKKVKNDVKVDTREKPKGKLVKPKKRSAEYAQEKAHAYRDGKWKPSVQEQEAWEAAMLKVHSEIKFDKEHCYRYQCPKCLAWFSTKGPGDVTRCRTHINKQCAEKTSTTLHRFFAFAGEKVTSTLNGKGKGGKPVKEPHRVACPGLTKREDARIDPYLNRSGASGGGGTDRRKLSQTKYQKPYSALTKQEKVTITQEQKASHQWDNDHKGGRVFARACSRYTSSSLADPPPCQECMKVLVLPAFKTAIDKAMPDDENRKYINKEWLNDKLGALYQEYPGVQKLLEDDHGTRDPILRYMLGRLKGKYDDETFEGLVSAFLQMRDRQDQGKGMQNFKYTEQFLEFCEDIHTTNPAAYRGLEQVLRVPTERSLQERRSKQPRFPCGVSNRNFELIHDHLKEINYDGPVGLACDDTKLFAGLHLTWDAEKKSHFLVGGCDGPIQVLDAAQVKSAMADAQGRKGTKLRLWVLSIPYPKIPPVIVTAEPIPDDLNAEDLASRSLKIIRGLVALKVKVVSYSCDGSDVERSSQRLMAAQADRIITHTIKSAEPGVADMSITIPVFDGQPVAIGQDSKHGLKTFRNNLYSGARLLTLGNYVAIYDRIRRLAYEAGSPLFGRDVDNVDRQDDGAATRLFSADVLEFITKNHPEYVGEIVYLFVFGELVDAYQNRFITHHERVKMVFRSLHFLNHWEQFLSVSGYAKSQHTISPQAIDISRTLINGYLALLMIHRDDLEGKFPFLPWLHSTEPCEHVFGEARRIVKDFTFRDFIYMIPKLKTRIRRAMRHFRINAKASAVGYVHTYFDTTKLNAVNLATFPSDDAMAQLYLAALAEVESLLLLLGITPSRLRNTATQVLPPIWAWLPNYENPGVSAGVSDTSSTSGLDCGLDDPKTQEPSAREELSELLNEKTDNFTEFSQTRIEAWRHAAFAMEASEYMHMHEDTSTEDQQACIDEDFDNIHKLDVQIPEIQTNEPTAAFGLNNQVFDDLDFSTLIQLRRAHQTEQAAKCARTRTTVSKRGSDRQDEDTASDVDSLAEQVRMTAKKRAEIVSTFREVIRQNKVHAPTQGLERQTRIAGGNNDEVAATGNAANAQVVAAATATRAENKRKKIFMEEVVPYLEHLCDARITAVRPLRPGDYVFFIRNPKSTTISLGKVVTMYSRTNGKNVRNALVQSSDRLSALSRIAVQVFEWSHRRYWTPMTAATTTLLTNEFQLIMPYQLLCLLSTQPTLDSDSKQVELYTIDQQQWMVMKLDIARFQRAFVKFKKREPKAGV